MEKPDPRDIAEAEEDRRRRASGWFWLACARAEGVTISRDPNLELRLFNVSYPDDMSAERQAEFAARIAEFRREIMNLLEGR